MIRAALSIDLESYWHAELLRTRIDRTQADDRVEAATRPLLALLARRRVKATFFTVGEVIESHPDLIREIVAAGHELGCHTYTHRPLWELDETTFEEEIVRFQQVVADVAPGVRPRGFRAPTFSLSPQTAWALDVLARHGYTYDSSVFPMKTPLYGVPGAPPAPYRPAPDLVHENPNAPLLEWPMTAWRIGPATIPVCGGFYLRVLPMPIILHGLKSAAKQGPIVIYLHPWELDPGTPRIPLSAQNRFITYHNTGRAMGKRLEKLLDVFDFQPMEQVLRSLAELKPLPGGQDAVI
jgi:polysaccharide deacetylase family protein (PEP-CTERM system associated)